jgi:hypothetical protein
VNGRAHASFVILLVGALPLATSVACIGGGSVPNPESAALAWAAAAERGDADALHGMLSKRSRATMSRTDVAATVASARAELRDQAGEIRATQQKNHIPAMAMLRWDDGTEASLIHEHGGFRVANAVLMPGGGTTPSEAVSGFREALKRRSYPAILRMLSPSLRAAVEAQLKGLEESIGDPDKLPYPGEAGDELEIKLENGHKLKLKRVDKTWYIDNFE